MVELRDVVRAVKTEVSIGPWRNGKVPRSDFPMGKKPYGIGRSFGWCVITFSALGESFRVLVVLNPGKQIYRAMLAVECGKDLRIVCSYEYHAGEDGWHCHACCDDLESIPVGVQRGPWIRRRPGAGRTHRRQNFGVVSQFDAIRVAIDHYGLDTPGALI